MPQIRAVVTDELNSPGLVLLCSLAVGAALATVLCSVASARQIDSLIEATLSPRTALVKLPQGTTGCCCDAGDGHDGSGYDEHEGHAMLCHDSSTYQSQRRDGEL
jgi:hypothetical protein